MILSTLDTFTTGRFWMSRSLLTLIIATALFSCAPALLINEPMPLPPAYELKSQHPLADTAVLTVPKYGGERSHGAKLTPRLVGSILLFLTAKLSLHPYFPATVGGIAFLLSGLVVGYRLAGDRVIGLLLGLTFAGLYTSAACFAMNWMPKPFDGVALGLVALTAALIDRGWLFALTAFLSCWTDERAVVSLGLIAFLSCSGLGWTQRASRLVGSFSVACWLPTLRCVLSWPRRCTGSHPIRACSEQLFR